MDDKSTQRRDHTHVHRAPAKYDVTKMKRALGSPSVCIVGSGISGMILAIELCLKGITDVTIYERTGTCAGTWSQNTYPGCACDVPSHWYSYSKVMNPDWSQAFSAQPEIEKYWEHVRDLYNLKAITKYYTNFEDATWNESKQNYTARFRDVSPQKGGLESTEDFTITAQVVVSCIGGFSLPLDKPPGLPGIENFEGKSMHSARWDNKIELKGKKVGIIGNGCSGAQIVPTLAKDRSIQLYNFSRTPSYFVPRPQHTYPRIVKWMFRYIPGVALLYRFFIAFVSDLRWLAWLMNNRFIRWYATNMSVTHIKKTAPKKYLDFLIPKYPFGCKRVIMDPGYLESLHQDNVELVTDPIDTIVDKGIRGKSGQVYDLDVIVLATGFNLSSKGLGLNLIGRGGMAVHEWWEQTNGPQAYLGTTLPHFPNFAMCLGPNVANGHASAIASIEHQIKHVVELCKAMTDRGITSWEIKERVEHEFNDKLHKRLGRTAWSGCASYYRMDNGKVIATWPGTVFRYGLQLRSPRFSEYKLKGDRGAGYISSATTAVKHGLLGTVIGTLRLFDL
ncbi:uncharacterized protein L969DRAFT_15820 [Mixia osmundae IAM 14324]|uniref:uncharacterized protein n=1 Tax=Mixia osmundae (strain CBS 9802 / IAM 14324 / JCM 22182 / KY 12970) TaxID=764103 RepID=UPI0004A54760|nr:uncharacterized protein L969DRAFT_15820 [Mixia osmundae IAM 14324]KEI40463.1 hypothetical protein L969DRAFT_15820 [Mixia osmundae IAM 14324]